MSDELAPQAFPPEVHERLAETRRLARVAKSKEDTRRATPEEIALAKTMLKPWMCGRPSSRTGLPCFRGRNPGMEVCRFHGGSLKTLRIKAQRTIASQLDPIVQRMIATATQSENLAAQVKAGQDLMDRAGVGALVQAKVRASKREPSTTDTRVQVQVGFLRNL